MPILPHGELNPELPHKRQEHLLLYYPIFLIALNYKVAFFASNASDNNAIQDPTNEPMEISVQGEENNVNLEGENTILTKYLYYFVF